VREATIATTTTPVILLPLYLTKDPSTSEKELSAVDDDRVRPL
jgi:hypothetical protein